MSREIKFRAWDDSVKEMFVVDRISFKGSYEYRFHKYEFTEGSEIAPGDCGEQEELRSSKMLMQYTGLKDKNGNGKEAFENDIAKVKKCWTNGVEYSDMVGIIKFKYGRWCIEDEDGNWLDLFDYRDRFEVIGNIYENAELLK